MYLSYNRCWGQAKAVSCLFLAWSRDDEIMETPANFHHLRTNTTIPRRFGPARGRRSWWARAGQPRQTLNGQACLLGRTECLLHGLAFRPGRTRGLLRAQDISDSYRGPPRTVKRIFWTYTWSSGPSGMPDVQRALCTMRPVPHGPPGRTEGPMHYFNDDVIHNSLTRMPQGPSLLKMRRGPAGLWGECKIEAKGIQK